MMKNPLSNPQSIAEIITLTGLATFVTLIINPAQAATFNVNGRSYEIITVQGTYFDYVDGINGTPWWRSPTEAVVFSRAVRDTFGLPNFNGLGPLFASTADPTEGFITGYSYDDSGGRGVITNINLSLTYAVGFPTLPSTVPEPLTMLGAIVAAGVGVSFKRKLAKNKKEA